MTTNVPMTTERLGEMTVEEVMALWPATAEVFNAQALACVGCALASFCTVQEAASAYEMPPERLFDALLAVITTGR